MRTFNHRTIVKVENRLNDTVEIGGKQFVLDPIFRKYWNTVQMAEVVATDRGDILPGDIVYVHHFVNSEEQVLPFKEYMSYLEYNQIYAVQEENEVRTLAEFVLVEPVTYGQAGLVKKSNGLIMTSHSENDKMERIGIARNISRKAMESGISDGDIILFNKNCEYEMLIDGQILYRMEIRDIITTLDSFDQLKA